MPHKLSIDGVKNRLTVKLTGFIDEKAEAALIKDMEGASKKLKDGATLLGDFQDFNIMKDASVLQQLEPYLNKVKASAVVLGSDVIGAMQVKQIGRDSKVNRKREYFDNIEKAKKWLDAIP